MNDRTDKLSALMDGELRDINKTMEQLTNDKEMQAVWRRYHLIRDVMKGQASEFSRLDISAVVSDSLKSEPVILTPLWRRLNPRYVMKQAAGFAIAAAVGTVAVLTVQQTQLGDTGNINIAKIDADQSSYRLEQQPQRIRQVSFTTRAKLDAAVESKLSGYLVNHNEFSKSTRVSGVMSYTRIVSFVPTAISSSSK